MTYRPGLEAAMKVQVAAQQEALATAQEQIASLDRTQDALAAQVAALTAQLATLGAGTGGAGGSGGGTNPPADVLVLAAPVGVQAGGSYAVAGTYSAGTAPTLTVSIDGAAGVTLPAGSTVEAGVITLHMPGLAAGSHTLSVSDGTNTSNTITFTVAAAAQPEALTVSAPSTMTVGTAATITGTYGNATLSAGIDYLLPGGAWTAASGATIANGQISFSVIPAAAGSGPVQIRDHANQGVTASSPTVTISAAAATGPAPMLAAKPTVTPTAGNGQVVFAVVEGPNGGAPITSHVAYMGASQAAVDAAVTAGTSTPITLDNAGDYTATVANGQALWLRVAAVTSAGVGLLSDYAWGIPQAPAVTPTPAPAWTPLTFAGATGTAPSGNSHMVASSGATVPLQDGNGNIVYGQREVNQALFDTIGKVGDGRIDITFAAGSPTYAQIIFRCQDTSFTNYYEITLPAGGNITFEKVLDGTYGGGTQLTGNFYANNPAPESGATLSVITNGENLNVLFNGSSVTGVVAMPDTTLQAPGYIGIGCYDSGGSQISVSSVAFTPIDLVPTALGGTQGVSTAPTQGVVPGQLLPTQFNTDNFGPGLYFPDTLSLSDGANAYVPLGSGFVRFASGKAGSFSVAGPDAALFYLGGLNGLQLFEDANDGAGTHYGIKNAAQPTFSITVVATDGGSETYTQAVTIANQSNLAFYPGGNLFLDTKPGSEQNGGANMDWAGASSLVDTASPPVIGYSGSENVMTETGITAYGAYSTELTIQASPAYTQKYEYWYAAEQPARATLAVNTLYTTSPVGTVLATASLVSDAGIASVTLIDATNTLTLGFLNGVATITTDAAVSQSSAAVATMVVTSGNGKITNIPVDYTVGIGTLLDSSHISYTPPTNLDNSMATIHLSPGPVPAGVVTVAGMSNPNITMNVLGEPEPLDSNPPIIQSFSVVQPSAGSNTGNVQANVCSARTYQVQFTAVSGSVSCPSQVYDIPVADVRTNGPHVAIVPGMGAATATAADSFNTSYDLYWDNPSEYKGLNVDFPGGVYNSNFMPPENGGTRQEFSRAPIGHPGNNQAYAPGPVVLSGPSPSNPTIIAFNGAPGAAAQCGFNVQDSDALLRNMVLSGCVQGSDTVEAIYRTGQTVGDCALQDMKLFNCADGFLVGDAQLSTISLTNVAIGYCGTGAYGFTHNIYIGLAGHAEASNVFSFSVGGGINYKCRSITGTHTNITCVDGQNGTGGNQFDFPVGGVHTITGFYAHKGVLPANNNIIVQMCEDGVHPLHAVNEITFDGGIVCATTPAGSLSTPIVAFNQGDLVSPVTGKAPTITVKNTGFWGIPQDHWFVGGVIDGGGNYALTAFPDIPASDPSNGGNINPAWCPTIPFYVPGQQVGEGLWSPYLTLQINLAAGAAVGTHVTQLVHFDLSGQPLSNPQFSMSSVGIGSEGGVLVTNNEWFAVDNQGNITIAVTPSFTNPGVSGTNPNGIAYFQVQVSGTDYQGNAKTYQHAGWVKVGTGYQPGYASAGGAVIAS